MSINVSQAFHRTSANPVDESMALTKAQMKTVNDNLMPAYYFTICQDDGEIYLYDKSATASAETGKFKKFEGSGGGGSTEGVVITKTLLASGWDANNRQTLTFTGYESNMGGVVGMPTNATAAQKEAYAESGINVYLQDGNQFTFSCKEKPSIDLPVTLYAGGGSGSGGGGTADFPEGGTTGQVLAKASNDDNDVEWKTIDADKTQYTTMPTASADNLGQIVQYVGETTVIEPIYIKGLFYQCVSDGESTPTYSWEQADVQSYPEADLANVFASGFPTASVIGDTKIYAPFEHQIGWWYEEVSGVMKKKPVYEKTIITTTPSSTSAVKTVSMGNDINVDRFIEIKGMFQETSKNCYPFFITNDGMTGLMKLYTVDNSIAIYCTVSAWLNKSMHIVTQYTKTTDEWEDA